MTQQNPLYNEDRINKRRLFYDNGLRFVEVKARQIYEYKPPTPVMKTHINQNIQAPSSIIGLGTSHYSVTLSMLFRSKKDYADWIQYIGAEHKYYDEKGTIYLGLVRGEPSVQVVEQETKYLVQVELDMTRKQDFEFRHIAPFIDIEEHWAKQHIEEMQEKGLVAVYYYDGTPNQYFRPEDKLRRSEAAAFLVRTHKYLDRLLRGY